MTDHVTSVTLTLNRTPPPELTPNRSRGKSKWSTDEHVATMRAAVAAAATDYLHSPAFRELPDILPVFTGDVAVDVVIYWERGPVEFRRRMGETQIVQRFRSKLDTDGAIGALKSSFDGLQVGIIANDRQIKQIAVEQIHDIDRAGSMTITVRDIGTAPTCCPVCGGPRVYVWALGKNIGFYCERCDLMIARSPDDWKVSR